MQINAIVFGLLFLSLFKKSQQIAENETSLVLLQVLLRHGARTVYNHYPNDINQDYWNKYVMGDIIPKGMKQAQDVGFFFAEKYGSFLGTSYNSSRVFARSTDLGRTIITSSVFLSSIFQPSSDQHWTDTPGLNAWIPIPIHTNNLSTDRILNLQYMCPRKDQLESLTKISPEYLRVQNENQEFYKNLSKFSGFDIDFTAVHILHDKYIVQTFIGLPNEQYILDNLEKIVNLSNHYYDIYFSFEYSKFYSGGVLKDAVNNMKNKIGGSSYHFFTYGIHDTMIIAIQKLLNTTTKFTQPEFVSSFILELRMDAEGSYYVQVLFKNNTPDEPIVLEPLNIYGCDKLCPYEKFLDLVKDSLITDIDEECKIRPA